MMASISAGARRRFRPSSAGLVVLLSLLLLPLLAASALAAPPAGTSIGNQASATYLDASATPRTATSNLVTTIVQQVASFTLTADGNRTASPGGQAIFPHTLINTGNGTDAFPLTLANLVGDDFDLTGLAIYVDANGDGIPDNFVPVATTGPLAAGAAYRFVVVSNVPGTQVGGEIARARISALSAFDNAQTAFNTDVVTVTGNAVISVTKAINQNSGNSPSGPYTYTLTYTNAGNAVANNLRLSDLLPAGMTYVPGSARWSVTGATVLTDADSTDAQGGAPNTVRFNFGESAAGTTTALINQVTPGASGTVTFQVTVNAGLAPQTINNGASYVYFDGAATVGPFTTNLAPFTVNQSASLTFTGQTFVAAAQGATLVYTNTLTNTGNGADTFDVTVGGATFPGGTSYSLYRSDGVTPLTDSNGNGTPDTGPVPAGGVTTVVLQVALPPAATGGPYQVGKTATSFSNPTQTATAIDVLNTITANSVDLTNNTPGLAAPGAGAGPEVGAVITNATNPGTTTRFTLYVNNYSAVADNFDMVASTDPTFVTFTLPAGWSVTFRDGANTIITNTGAIAAAGNSLVYADVTVPASATAGVQALYFRSRSPNSGAADRIHDAVDVGVIRALTLVPNNTAQVTPGGAFTYTHLLANNGNVTEGAGTGSIVTFALTDNQVGWSSSLFYDQNNDGVLDPLDPAISDLSTIGGIAPGTSVRLFARVFAPAGAPLGQVNLTTITATTVNVAYTSAVPAPATATDNTTVLNGQLQIVKLQALDADCDGIADGGVYAGANITAGAIPGACIRYEITVTNTGTTAVTNVTVDDATPVNSTYSGAVPAATTVGSITAPAPGSTGTVSASIATLGPGASAVITFGIRIDP